MRFYRIIFLILLLTCLHQVTLQAQNNFVVVELFTSQGDINCPKADKILSGLVTDADANGKNIYCISEHVDFWNRFGWKDPFSSLKYTTRLASYSAASGEKETYTPYFVINGKPVSTSQVKDAVARQLALAHSVGMTIQYQVFSDTLDLNVKLDGFDVKKKQISNYFLNIVVVEKLAETKVTAGDNKGTTLRNDHPALMFQAENLKGLNTLTHIPLKKIKKAPGRRLIIFLQDKQTRAVLAATSVSFE